jgi:hypothetical protein
MTASMTKKATTAKPASIPVLVSPRSHREVLLDALLETTTDPIHARILKAYKSAGTVDAAETEFSIIIEEIINEA